MPTREGAELSLRRLHCYWLLEPELQERLARHLYLLSAREYLYARARRRAHARANCRPLASAGDCTDDRARDCSATNFFRRIRAAALPFQRVSSKCSSALPDMCPASLASASRP